jgi:hypothetical protein
MPRTSVIDSAKAKRAAYILKNAPFLTAEEAMLAAKFPAEQAKLKSMQRNVRRNLPGGTKRDSIALLTASSHSVTSISVSSDKFTDISPLTDASERSEMDENTPPSPQQKPKKQRKTSKQAQDMRVANHEMQLKLKKAHKEATIMYDREVGKEKGGMSVRQVEEFIKKKNRGIGPSKTTIHRYVIELGLVGMSPLKTGPEGNIPREVYKSLCMAYGSFLRINQINGRGGDNLRSKLILLIAETMKIGVNSAAEVVKRLCRDTAADMKADKLCFAEERRVRWTTFSNLEMWFNSWEKMLIDLGLMEDDGSGKFTIPDHQLRNILNFDETCLSLDGSSINRGGRPAATFHDPRLPQVGISTSKTSQTLTMITGSNAWGEALPPHFQFMTTAQSDEGKQIRNNMVRYMKNVRGEFGLGEVALKPISYGMNECGGMDTEEFAKYVCNAIMPLYPNASPTKGKWVVIKCDSGPGRLNMDLMADMRTSGFILFPGVPNSTAVTQETDQNYGPFKTGYAKNLDLVVDARMTQNKNITLHPWQVGLIVFGGVDEETNAVVPSAFEAGFSRDSCRHAWAKVGAAPLTRFCLTNSKVRRSLGDGSDNYQQLLTNIQDANNISTHALSSGGYNGNVLRRELVSIQAADPLTEEHSQERLQLLAKANTHGKLFSATGGMHLTSDDIFISAEMSTREKEMKRLSTEKNRRLKQMKVEEKAQRVLNTKGDAGTGWNVEDVNAVLAWYNHPQRNKLTSKESKLKAWDELRAWGKSPPTYERWTDDDEMKLLEASKANITVDDTALGRAQMKRKHDFDSRIETMSKAEWEAAVAKRESIDSATNFDANNASDGAVGWV